MAFSFEPLALPDVVLVKQVAFRDARGFFLESYRRSAFAAFGIPDFVQDNHSCSAGGTLRGLHYQLASKAQGKLVRVVVGTILDVAVDIRRQSPTFGRWVSVTLSDENQQMLYIPPGFAHGFLAQTDRAEVLYKTTSEYAPEAERGIVWNDADLGIAWPIQHPILSPRDSGLPRLRDADNDF